MRGFCLTFGLYLVGLSLVGSVALAEDLGADNRFDAAPFALPLDNGDTSPGLRWGEPRKIRAVVVEFADATALPALEKVRLQYWLHNWDGGPDPVSSELGTGGDGWAKMDDWTNGKWKDADAQVKADARSLTFTFASSAAKEFEKLGAEKGVTYRKTLKLRLQADEALPRVARLRAITDATLRPLSIRFALGKPAASAVQIPGADSGTLEIYNGVITGMQGRGINAAGKPQAWSLDKAEGEVRADILMAVDPIDGRYDRTIVTLRSKHRPFSVAADEIARGDRILVDDLGVLAVRGEDAIGLEAYRQKRSEFPGRTIYDRVADSREQTLPQAWDAMPVRRPMFYPHAVPGNRNSFRQWPNGDLDIPGHVAWFNRPRSERDSARKDWESDTLKLTFGFPPDDLRGGRELLEGKWPLLRTWWQQGPLFYEFSTIVDTLSAKLDDIPFDEPTVMLAQIRIVNTGEAGEAGATLRLGSGEKGSLVVTGDRVIEQNGEKQRLRYLMKGAETGTLGVDGRATTWSATLKPGESRKLMLVIPSITLTRDDEIEALRKRDCAADVARIVAFWRNLNGGGTLIRTPEPWLNDFYQTHLRHLLVNCFRDADSDALFAHVGTFNYGAFTNESVMMVSDLDRRGHHAEAERCLNGWLRYQGTASLPGNFTTKKGMFYGANRHEMGGYNKHHGYAMWNMAEHWRFTRDRRWMEASAPKLVQACDWVIEQRRTTMVKNADGSRPLEYGWLPAGGLEDVQDYWHWLATNSATVWGFDALAAALADFGHPEAGRLVREAKAYHDDVVAGLTEARILTPVVRLRDGTYVPKFPSRLYERGRSRGWIRETLEGAIFLPVQGIIDPNSIETTWIMKDYEDNLYISNQYGYSISDFERFWFSRGGFSMQAQLLDSPIPYIQRDEPLHYLRTYFNAFASAFEPGIRMCNEHSLPELGMPAGDMFKTSDEAQSTYWLRLIFVHEDGNRLILGQAMPRYWLAQGGEASIERAASYFGPLSFRITSDVEHGRIRAIVDPPERNRPQEICVRLRHPDRKGIRSVTVNGKPYTRFDAKKEWVVLPGNIQGRQEIEAQY